MSVNKNNNAQFEIDNVYLKFEKEILQDLDSGLAKVHSYLKEKYSLYLHINNVTEILLFFPDKLLRTYLDKIKALPIDIKIFSQNEDIIRVAFPNNLYYIYKNFFDKGHAVLKFGYSAIKIATINKKGNKYIVTFEVDNPMPRIQASKLFYAKLLKMVMSNILLEYSDNIRIKKVRQSRDILKQILRKFINIKIDKKQIEVNYKKAYPEIDINKFPYNIVYISESNATIQKHIYINDNKLSCRVTYNNMLIKTRHNNMFNIFQKYINADKTTNKISQSDIEKINNTFWNEYRKIHASLRKFERIPLDISAYNIIKELRIKGIVKSDIKKIHINYTTGPINIGVDSFGEKTVTDISSLQEALKEINYNEIINNLRISKLIIGGLLYSKKYSFASTFENKIQNKIRKVIADINI